MLLGIFITICHSKLHAAMQLLTYNVQRDGLFEIMKYFLVLLSGVQLHVGDVSEAGGVQWEVRQDDGDGRVAAESNLQFTKFTIYIAFHRHTVILPELAEVR